MGVIWHTEKPTEFFGRVERSVDPMMHDVTETISERLRREIVKYTPKSDPFSAPPGHIHLKDEIHSIRVRKWKGNRYTGAVESNKDYAPDVEYRTKPHWIPNPPGRPTLRMLRFYGTRNGRWVSAVRVWHPGTPGQHMFLIGTLNTQARVYDIAEPRLRRWTAQFRTARPA